MTDPADDLAGHAPTQAAPEAPPSGSGSGAVLPAAPWSEIDAPLLQRAHGQLMHRLFGDPLRPQQRGRYRLLRELGRGGMGTVWSAEDPELGRTVAIKLLSLRGPGTTGNSRDEVRALMREAQAIARLSDPHVVEIYDVGLAGEQAYIVMELVDGGTLASWLAAGDHSPAAIVDALVQAGRGLAAAHRAGVLHRDFKPANVLRTRAGVCKVADFGLAIAPRSIDDAAPTHALVSIAGASTELGPGIAGTPAFMAPEQHAGLPLDARADQYALCVTAWLALAGTLPFAGSLPSLVFAKREGAPALPSARGIPSALWRIVARGLASDPAERWPDVDALCDALARAVAPRRARTAALVLGAAAVLAGGATMMLPPAQPSACGSSDALAGRWASERAAVDASLATRPGLASTRTELLDTLDAWSAKWDRARAQVCAARGEAAQLGDARLACLGAARRQFEQTTASMQVADDAAFANVRDRVAALVDPASCGARGEEPELSAEVVALRERLGELDAREQVGRDEGALELASTVLEQARELGDTVALVHCDLVLARIANALGRYELAAARGEEALWTAMGANDDAAAFDAALVRASTGVLALDYEDAQRHVRTAQSLLEQLGDDPLRAARLERTLAMVATKRGRIEDGVEHSRRALAHLGDHGDPPLRAQLELDLGAAERQLGELDSARARFELARDLLVGWYGPSHVDVADVELMIGITTASAVGPRAALVPIDHATAIYRDALAPDDARLANALSVQGFLHASCGEHEAARAAWQAAHAIHEAALGREHPRTLAAAASLAAALVELGRLDEAEPLVLATVEGLRAAGEYGLDHLAFALDVEARLELARGRPARAITALEGSIVAAREYGDPELVVEPTARLAEILTARGEPGRARALLEPVLAAAAPKPSIRRATAELALADAMWSAPADRAHARALVEAARTTVQTRQGPPATVARMDAWLLAHGGAADRG